jgi:small subunit ribosomal protein S6
VNNYELIMIFDPNLGEEKTGAFVAKIEEKIKGLGGEIDKTEKWGTRRLASMIKKAKTMTQGYYVLVRFKSPAGVPAELRALLKVSENVIRYFLSKAVIVLEGHVRREAPGAARVAEAVEIGEIKGKPLGEPQ